MRNTPRLQFFPGAPHWMFALIIALIAAGTTAFDQESKGIDASHFEGAWTYRSLHNFPIDTPFCNLEFATAVMKFQKTSGNTLKGVLDMGQFGTLNLEGSIERHNDEVTFQVQGDGIPGSATNGWQYNYKGYVIPGWPNGIAQVDACAGSVIRSKDHGRSRAGKTASFYMVRQ